LVDVGDTRTLVHGIENFLAAALGADPRLAATRGAQRFGHARTHEIGTRLDGERHAAAAFFERAGELVHPVDAKAEDVVGEPDVIRTVVAPQVDELGRDLARRALQVLVAPDGFRAPVAAERAAARGGHVQAEVAVRATPGAAIFL